MEHVLLRVANAYGEDQLPYRGQGVISIFLAKIYENKSIIVFGDGSVVRDYIYVTDVVRALYMAAHYSPPNRIYNVGSSQGVMLKDLINKIATITSKDVSIKYKQARPSDVSKVILGCKFVKSEIKWDVEVNLDEGIERTWTWIQSYMKVMLKEGV